eukprot:s1406_g16.t1
MGDRDVKLARLLETIGEGADLDFAREVLIANNWDLQAAVAVILGDGVPVAAAPVPVPSDAAAAAATAPTGLEHTASNDVRAPMRTGFHEALLTPDAAEQARQDKAREEERLRVEAEKIAAEERRQREMEEAHKKNLARLAEEQRAAAERQAIERKKQKVQEEQEALRKGKEKKGRRRDDDSDEDLEDIPVDPGIMLSDLSNQLAKDDVKGPAETPSAREDVNHGSVGVSAGPVEKPVEEVPVSSPEAPVSAPKAPALAPTQGEEASPKVTKEEEAPHEEKADSFVSALRALRKKYREAEPAALAACFRTWRHGWDASFMYSNSASCVRLSHVSATFPLRSQNARYLKFKKAATCSHLQPLEWPQVAAWTANSSPNGPTFENLKKMAFLANCIFFKLSVKREVRVETKRKE